MLESTLVATRIHYWHKNIGKVVEHAVSPYLAKWNSIDSADVLVGADHGQGKSCAGVGMLMWSGNQCVIDEVRFVGKATCKKDTLKVSQSTLASHLNAYMNKILLDGVGKGVEVEGYVQIYESKSDKKRRSSVCYRKRSI